MANEAQIIELVEGGVPLRMTVANATAIAKGTLLKVVDPRTAQATSENNDAFIGVAASEKVANDGSTSLDVYTKGIFIMRASSTTAEGDVLKISGANTVLKAGTVNFYKRIVGTALSACSGAGDIIVFMGHGG